MSVEIAVDVDLECSTCGSVLVGRFHPPSAIGSDISITVDICATCMDTVENAGYDKGYAQGEDDNS